MHYHRSEHWVVVAGFARVHYGDEILDLGVNQSTYHGKEVVHALENIGDKPLELIEVQVGAYLGEDDIVRFDDKYGRS
jgi:mannose-6-phosphate isomerase-like protein (cupin superfamily)